MRILSTKTPGTPNTPPLYPGKRKGVAIVLWFVTFGYLGLHNFYLRQIKAGLGKWVILLAIGFSPKNPANRHSPEEIFITICTLGLLCWNIYDLIQIIRSPRSNFGKSADMPAITPTMQEAQTRPSAWKDPAEAASVPNRIAEPMDSCLDCGQPAVKQEDFAIYDYRWEQNTRKDIRLMGLCRLAFCRACMEKRHKTSIQSEPSAFKVATANILGACLGPIFLGFFSTLREYVNAEKLTATEQKEAFKAGSGDNFAGVSLCEIMSDVSSKKALILLNGEAALSLVEGGMAPEDILRSPDVYTPVPLQESGRSRAYASMLHRENNSAAPCPTPEWVIPLYQKLITDGI